MKFIDFLSKLFKNKPVDSKLSNLTSGLTFQEKFNDLGVFKYYNDFFSLQYQDFFKEIKWKEINQIIVYKRDLFTIDRVEMEIVYGENSLTINEDIPGWYQFVLKTKEIFPTIPKDWDNTIIHPSFATNLTVIYDKTKTINPPDNKIASA